MNDAKLWQRPKVNGTNLQGHDHGHEFIDLKLDVIDCLKNIIFWKKKFSNFFRGKKKEFDKVVFSDV